MAICSHCGNQSQASALNCEFCGFPLSAQGSDISGLDTVLTAPPPASDQNGAPATTIDQQGSGALARVIVRPLQDGGEAPREFALTGQTVSIGRSPSCEIVLEHDQLTSRRHALLRYDGARYTVVDLGSSNGTFVNDAEIRDATPLHPGDRIIVGEHELMFTADVAEPAPAAPAATPDQMSAQQEMPTQESAASGAEEVETGAMETVMAPMEAPQVNGEDVPGAEEVSAVAEVADISDIEDISDVSGVEDVEDASDVVDVHDVADVSEVSAVSESGEEEPAPGEPQDVSVDEVEVEEQLESAALPQLSMPGSMPLLARAPSSGALRQPGGELDQLREQMRQLVATSETVAQHAAEETELSERRRQALAETRDQLHAILAGIQNASSQPNDGRAGELGEVDEMDEMDEMDEVDGVGDLSDLIQVTQQAADDPNHLQNVSRLAEHAKDIARALEALQAHRIQPPRLNANENALAELRALRARLDELA